MGTGGCQAEKAVCRGGSWIDNGRNLRSAYRNNDRIDIIDDNNGLRLARAHAATGWRSGTRQHPDMTGPAPGSCKQPGCRGVSNRYESVPRNRSLLS